MLRRRRRKKGKEGEEEKECTTPRQEASLAVTEGEPVDLCCYAGNGTSDKVSAPPNNTVFH